LGVYLGAGFQKLGLSQMSDPCLFAAGEVEVTSIMCPASSSPMEQHTPELPSELAESSSDVAYLSEVGSQHGADADVTMTTRRCLERANSLVPVGVGWWDVLLKQSAQVALAAPADFTGVRRGGPRYREAVGIFLQTQAASSTVSEKTTVMLRNLPSHYTRTCLKDLLESMGFAGRFDFLYLRRDFKTESAGNAVVNLVTSADAERLMQRMNQRPSKRSAPTRRSRNASWGAEDRQGRAANIAHFRNHEVMHESVSDSYRPALFDNGTRIPFPAPTRTVRPPRRGSQRIMMVECPVGGQRMASS